MKVYLISLPMMFMSLGCMASYSVGVNGYSSTGRSLDIPDGSSISVIAERDVPNPILQKEVGAKIRHLLAEQGYTSDANQPDYYLLFNYGIDKGQSVTDFIPLHYPSYYDERWWWDYGYGYGYGYGYETYIPYSSVVYARWLVLKLIEGQAYSKSKNAEPLWICEVGSSGSSSDLRDVINYLLVAAFGHFGRDTGRQIVEVIYKSDERIRGLADR